MNEDGSFRKVAGEGVTEAVWEKMVALAAKNGWKGGNFKKLNLPIDNWLLAQPRNVRERMSKRVEDFVYQMLVSVFNAADTAPLAMELLVEAGSYDIGTSAVRLEDPAEWTPEEIIEKAKLLDSDKGPKGDFSD
jgi:hypothetical protein